MPDGLFRQFEVHAVDGAAGESRAPIPAMPVEERRELQVHAARLAGVILRPWLPADWGRRLIMMGIVVLGAQQAFWVGNYEPLVWWLLLPLFSPRIVGFGAYFLGRLSALFRS